MEILEKLLIAMGGGATAIIAFLTIFKSMFFKVFDKAINTTFDKNFEKYRNKLSRRTTAYEILLKKEFDFYERLDIYLATLVPLVQDLVYYMKCDETYDQSKQYENYRKELITYLEIIPKFKNDCILYQSYIPEDLWIEVTSLISEMQKELKFWGETAKSLFSLEEQDININKAEEISFSILNQISKLEFSVKNRLIKLSEE